jgi:hypothetical protein
MDRNEQLPIKEDPFVLIIEGTPEFNIPDSDTGLTIPINHKIITCEAGLSLEEQQLLKQARDTNRDCKVSVLVNNTLTQFPSILERDITDDLDPQEILDIKESHGKLINPEERLFEFHLVVPQDFPIE